MSCGRFNPTFDLALHEPFGVIPKKSGGVRITVNYRKLNKLCALSQLPIPRVDDTLDKLLKGRIYSLFDMKSSFHQITVHRDTIPLTPFVTSSGLFEWLKMPQGSSAAPGWFCKVVNEVIKNFHGVASYLDDLIVFDDTPATHVGTMRALFERLRTHNLKLTPPKATIGATEADFLGHTTSPDGVRPNGAKVSALTKMPMPRDVKQLRSLLGGLSYYRKFLPNMAKRIRPLTTQLKKQENLTGRELLLVRGLPPGVRRRPMEHGQKDTAEGLERDLYLAKGAKVMLSKNLYQQVGLVNGIRGEVVELVCADDAPPPKLPLYVVVKFEGYSGGEWSSQERYRRCVPISPVDTTWQDGGTQVRTQLPLRLCWAITMHKSQGQTLAKAVIDLGPKEACTGLTFVCLSRAKRLVDLMVEPMSFDRIGNLGNSPTMKARLQEEVRLGELAQSTRVKYTDMGVFSAVAGNQ
ncbi:unnamed protein product [Ectocarpus sp. CCAP 1310/34]|nr:unnamed protein product [Ectocarpus sp. CCAP 1310/34]